MEKIIVKLIALYISTLYSFSAQASEQVEFKSIHSQGEMRIVLVNKNTTENQLSKHGKSNCADKEFCVIWYFDDKKKAQVGIKRAKAGNIFDPIPGLISEYIKTKMVNEITCYKPKGSCL